MEMLNRSIRRPVDLAAGLGIQPFATVPYIRTQSETRRKHSAVVVVLVLIAVVIPAGLLALHTYYMPLDLLWTQLWAVEEPLPTAVSTSVPDPPPSNSVPDPPPSNSVPAAAP